jgi:ribosomal protein L37AE/L43A
VTASERAVPYCCPFCGEEDLRPVPSGAVEGLTRGGWHCRSCLRLFTIGFHGLHQPAQLEPSIPDTHSSFRSGE